MTSEYVRYDSFCLGELELSTVDINSFLALAVKIFVDHAWAGSPYLLRFCYDFVVPFVYAKDKLVCYRCFVFVSDCLTSSCEKLIHRQSRPSRVKRQIWSFSSASSFYLLFWTLGDPETSGRPSVSCPTTRLSHNSPCCDWMKKTKKNMSTYRAR